jgi:aquaporin Z
MYKKICKIKYTSMDIVNQALDHPAKLIVEGVGTFFFLSVILHSLNDSTIGPFGVAVALLAVIYFGNSVSGAHFNPAVTFAMLIENRLPFIVAVLYIAAQLVGAFGAVEFNHYILKRKTF